jgi:hypothetical protein
VRTECLWHGTTEIYLYIMEYFLLSCMARGFTSTESSMRLSFLNLGLSSMQVGPSHVSLLIILNTGLNSQAEDPVL